jgi:two-component system LytT family sensor kinase
VILQTTHRGRPTFQPGEITAGATRLVVGIAIVVLVYRLVRRVPWPRPFRASFALIHVVTAPLAALAWFVVATFLENMLAPGGSDLVGSQRLQEFLLIGTVFYCIIVGVAYAADNSARAARAESAAAQTQLAALRAQLHPHFLFNSLHTVVQLIPVDPRRAAEAAELVGELLRAALEEQRDEVTVAEEWRFVSRYLELERIRFGDRLVVRSDIPDALLTKRVPSFSLQTLVENAVHHGAARRVEPTELLVTGKANEAEFELSVRNAAGDSTSSESRPGTGLARLRERLSVLYGASAKLESGRTADGQFESVLTLPARSDEP